MSLLTLYLYLHISINLKTEIMRTLEFIKSELVKKYLKRYTDKNIEIVFGEFSTFFLHNDGVTLECHFEDCLLSAIGEKTVTKGLSVLFTCANKTPKGYISSKKINVNIKDKSDITLEEVTELLKFNTDAIKNTFDPFYAENQVKRRNAAAWNYIATHYITDPYCTK